MQVVFPLQSTPCELKAVGGLTQAGGQDLALKSGPFVSEEAAQVASDRTLAGLFLTSLRKGFAVLTQARVRGGAFTAYGRNMVAGDAFDAVHEVVYGFTVFDDRGRTGVVRLGESHVLVKEVATAFVDSWSSAVRDAAVSDERIRTSYEV